jgi:starvation-inducible outer membrane lipoprotein
MSKYTLTLEMITISNYHAGYVGNEEWHSYEISCTLFKKWSVSFEVICL